MIADMPLILVVDDIADARFMYSLYLTTHDFRVIEAANGEDAIRLAHEQQPALLLVVVGQAGADEQIERHSTRDGKP